MWCWNARPLPCMPSLHHTCPLFAMYAPFTTHVPPSPHVPPLFHHACPPFTMHAPFTLHREYPLRHAPAPPPVDRMTDACENITFPQLLLRTVINETLSGLAPIGSATGVLVDIQCSQLAKGQCVLSCLCDWCTWKKIEEEWPHWNSLEKWTVQSAFDTMQILSSGKMLIR